MTAGQLRADILHGNAHLHHQHQHMIGKVSNFVNRLRLVLGFAGDDDLGALLSHLFEDLVQTLLEQVGGVGAFRQIFLPADKQLVKAFQLEFIGLFTENRIVKAGIVRG